MLRLPGLQEGPADPLGAAGPPRRLAQKLKRALGGSRIGIGKADVGIDHAHEGQQRKIMPLGDELGADDEVVVAARGGPSRRRSTVAISGILAAPKREGSISQR